MRAAARDSMHAASYLYTNKMSKKLPVELLLLQVTYSILGPHPLTEKSSTSYRNAMNKPGFPLRPSRSSGSGMGTLGAATYRSPCGKLYR